MNYRILLCTLLCSFLTACSGGDDAADSLISDTPPEELYREGKRWMSENRYTKAAEQFDEVERQHPYSPLSPPAQILAAYARYLDREYDTAILGFERFIKMQPSHASVAYAYYMIALSYYEQISDVGRDQGMSEKARAALVEVSNRFPDSPYARDARIKLDLVVDHLAGKEMMIGRYYLNRQEYLASINRFITVVENYQTTAHTAEALHRLVEAYLLLGVEPEARKYAALLGHNFPGSAWYEQSYALLKAEKAQDN